MNKGFNIALFWSRVDIQSDHWLWTGQVGSDGYPLYSGQRANRLMHEMEIGSVPKDHIVHHTCHNILCVRPEHLKAVTQGAHLELHGNPKPTFKSICINNHPKEPGKPCKICHREARRHWESKLSDEHKEARRVKNNEAHKRRYYGK